MPIRKKRYPRAYYGMFDTLAFKIFAWIVVVLAIVNLLKYYLEW